MGLGVMLTILGRRFRYFHLLMKMQAALWYGPEEVRVESVEVPEVGPGEVLVRIGTALTCGTDFKLFRRGHPLLVKNVPSPFGHEMAGTIAEVGSKVKGFKVGDRAVAANSAPCDECTFCRRGRPNLCKNLEFLNGAYAEYIRIPTRIVEKNLRKIPAEVTFRDAALSEPLACALHCFERVGLQPEETVCIIGAGACGLLFVQLAKGIGARVICLARGEGKLAVARALGADHVVSILHEGYRERLKDLTEGLGPDVVIEAAGVPQSWEMATEIVCKGGRVWFYGGCAKGSRINLDTHRLHYDELSLRGVFHHTPVHFARALSYIAERKISVDSLVTGQRRLQELPQVFLKGEETNPLKIAIVP